MPVKTFKLIGLDEDGIRQSQRGLRLVCLIEGGGRLAVWGSAEASANINAVQSAVMPSSVECDCFPAPEPWATKYQHNYWVHESKARRVISN